MNLLARVAAFVSKRRRLTAGAILSASMLTVGLTAAAPASADNYVRTVCLQNQVSHYYMSKGIYPNFNPLIMNYDACGATPTLFDVWAITAGGNTLVNHDGYFCLTDASGGSVYLSPCDSNNVYNRWDFHDAPGGITIVSEGTRWCLSTDNSEAVWTSPCDVNNPWQIWNQPQAP
jgi:hypothetical protein